MFVRIIFCFLLCVNSFAVDIPIIEAPFNFTTSYGFPGPEQALQLSTGTYQWFHLKLDQSGNDHPTFWNQMGILAFDIFMEWMPLGSSWLHEEWHRGSMGLNRVNSYNAIYDFNIGAEIVSVNHVTDEDLIRMKASSPSDFVRLPAAGMESQLVQNQLIEKERFFDNFYTWDEGILLINYINVISYLNTCSSSQSTAITNIENSEDGSDISKRDFTGLDCLGWVYDLFRPDEPYTARGTHPSGVGINRYRTRDNLTQVETGFLALQSRLSFLNLVNPMLWGFPPHHKDNYYWTWDFKHYLTSFGYDVDFNFYFNYLRRNYLLQLHDYQNSRKVFSGLTLELWRWPGPVDSLQFSYLFSLWTQPEKQRFDDETGKLGGKLMVKAYYRTSDVLEYFASLSLKSPGWVAADLNLASGLSGFLGVTTNSLF